MSRVLVVLLLVLGLSAPGLAGEGRWSSKLERIESDLGSGEWKKALDRCATVRAKMLTDIERAPELARTAARALRLQAIAEANLGRDDAARWHWLAAQSFLGAPDLDLSEMGRAESILATASLDEMPQTWIAEPAAAEGSQRYRQVRIRRPVEPTFPRALRKSGKVGQVHLEIVVDPSGRARRPRVLDAGLVPTMAFPVLDALRLWQFDPGQRGSEPVAVLYELRIDYR